MAVKANLKIDQGTDFQALIDVVNSDGSIFDLSTFTPFAQMRKSYSSSTFFNFEADDNGLGGQITLRMSRGVTGDIEPGNYLYDVQIYSEANTVTKVVEGTVTIVPSMTRVDFG